MLFRCVLAGVRRTELSRVEISRVRIGGILSPELGRVKALVVFLFRDWWIFMIRDWWVSVASSGIGGFFYLGNGGFCCCFLVLFFPFFLNQAHRSGLT